jgi:hypothetical protein
LDSPWPEANPFYGQVCDAQKADLKETFTLRRRPDRRPRLDHGERLAGPGARPSRAGDMLL